jgi:hypothetical protein
VEEKQPEEEPIFIELDEEEIALESKEEEEISPENLVEIEIPSEYLEEEIPTESTEKEETLAEKLEMEDTKPEVFIGEEPIEEPIEKPMEESVEAPVEEPIEVPIKESIEEPINGMVLRKIRRKQGLTILQLADSTQIPKKIVEYIEREEYGKLPDAGYLRWYLTTFAKALSLDPKDTADQYMKHYRQWTKDQDSQD